MERPTNSPLVDRHGQPLSEPIQRVMRTLVPRLRREYPAFTDLALTEVLEEVGQQVADREAREGPLRHMRAYAWRALQSVAASRLRRSEMRVQRGAVDQLETRDADLSRLSSDLASQERIETDILLREVLALLAHEERVICILKIAGFSSREIARRLGKSVTAVNVSFWRSTRKIRKASVSWRRVTDPR
jgi:DNA-directed RNA polymerase specialized sigma24 family protein